MIPTPVLASTRHDREPTRCRGYRCTSKRWALYCRTSDCRLGVLQGARSRGRAFRLHLRRFRDRCCAGELARPFLPRAAIYRLAVRSCGGVGITRGALDPLAPCGAYMYRVARSRELGYLSHPRLSCVRRLRKRVTAWSLLCTVCVRCGSDRRSRCRPHSDRPCIQRRARRRPPGGNHPVESVFAGNDRGGDARGDGDDSSGPARRMRDLFRSPRIMASPYMRRIVLVVCACALAAPLLRGALCDALLARGDGALAVGSQKAAWQYYQRAEAIGGSAKALRRIVTLALLSNDPSILRRALRSLRAVKPTKTLGPLLFDRALLEWRNHDTIAAERDARTASRLTRSIAPLLFAGILARHRGAKRVAYLDFRQAHRRAPNDPRPLYQLRKGER